MAYFMPSYFQKRILRYALSRLDLLDTDALDLDRLDIVWGKRSTVELRDVGLRLKQLASILQLPDYLVVTKARVLLLRITVPADIYSSGILVEVEGVEGRVLVAPGDLGKATNANQRRRGGLAKSTKANRPRSAQPLLHDPGGVTQSSKASSTGREDEPKSSIPSTADLAQSFLQTEPARERVELQAALSKSQTLQQSLSNEEGDDNLDTGLGTGFSLPGFIADFLKGVGDRLRLEIKDVQLDLDLNIDLPYAGASDSAYVSNSEKLTIRVTMDTLKIDELVRNSHLKGELRNEGNNSTFEGHGCRRISLLGIRCMLISEASTFNVLGQSSGPPSPIATHSGLRLKTSSKASRISHQTRSSASSSSTGVGMAESTVLPAVGDHTTDKSAPSMVTMGGQNLIDVKVGKLHSAKLNSMRFPSHGAQQDLSQLQDSMSSETVNPYAAGIGAESPVLAHSSNLPFEAGIHNSPTESKSQNPHRLDSLYNSNMSDSYPFGATLETANWPNSPSPGSKQSRTVVQRNPAAPSYSASSSTSDLSNHHRMASGSDEYLTQSRIFSPEEAQSLYMSAISQVPGDNDSSESLGADSDSQGSLPSESSVRMEGRFSSMAALADRQTDSVVALAVTQESCCGRRSSRNQGQTIATVDQPPRLELQQKLDNQHSVHEQLSPATSPQTSSDDSKSNEFRDSGASQASTRVAKHFVSIDSVIVIIPQLDHESSLLKSGDEMNKDPVRSGRSYSSVLCTFSDFDISRSPNIAPYLASDNIKEEQANPSANLPVSVLIHDILLFSDMGLTRLMVAILQQMSSLQSREPRTDRDSAYLSPTSHHIAIHLERLSWKFVDVIRGSAWEASRSSHMLATSPISPADSDVLLVMTVEDLDVVYSSEGSSSSTNVSTGKFKFGYTSDTIVAFDSGVRMRESTRDGLAPVDKDIALTVLQSPGTIRINVSTLPIHVTLDLARLDETFSWFGGLSTVLGLGSSMMSTVTVTDSRTKHQPNSKRTRGVHFDTQRDEVAIGTRQSTRQKITVRVGGLLFDLQGKESSLRFESSAVKLVSRYEGIGVQIDKLKFGGPFLRHKQRSPAITLHVGNIKAEYLSFPKEVDLARLLALLSPSRDRDETDDDILLETLFRQRRKGGVIRLTVETVEGSISRLEDLDQLKLISEELSKLSTVAKYLPEDDRPGILSLILIRKLRLEVELNANFGSAEVVARNIEVAHVTFPSLILSGINTLRIQRQAEELLGEALPLDVESENPSPMIMAKLIGDEMEPTMKFKLWNLRLEYHVSTLMAAMGLSEAANGEVIIADMVSSVVTLTDHRPPPRLTSQSSQSSERSSSGAKALKFEVSIRDSIIGLNPRLSVSKGLVVLSKTKIVCSFPKHEEAELDGFIDIKKASLMIIDSILNASAPTELPETTIPTKPRSQVQTLSTMGYVAVSDISAARLTWQIVSSGKDGEKSIDIEVRDDLFVLETCADSTHTLQSIFSGLSPPMPPSRELKYRTEVVPVQDMLASFTGDEFATGEDVAGHEEHLPLGLEEGDLMDDDVPQNLEFVSGFYNPDPAVTGENIAHSILEGDLDFLASPPITREFGDPRLLQSFQEQYEIAPGNEPLSFDDDHFGNGSGGGNAVHKWNSDRNAYDIIVNRRIRESPLRLRVRDVHIIWNLFDGYDWRNTRDVIGQAVADVESKAAERLVKKDKRKSREVEEEEEEVIGDFLFNSIYIGVPANHDPRELSRHINRNIDDLTSEAESYASSTTIQESPARPGSRSKTKRNRLRLNRSKHHKMTFELKGLAVDLVVFPPLSGETQSSIDIRVQDLEIFDHVPTSTWKKFATYMHDAGERQSGSSMVHIEILNVRPVPELAASEVILKATILPLRLHVDQDALDFMTRFFEFKDDSAPVRSSNSESIFFQRAEVNSVKVKLDFKPKRVDYAGIRSGHTTEFMNFFILDQADMVLRHVIIYGVSGFEKLGKTLNDIWMPDVKRNQLPGVLAGLAPVRSLVNVGGGMKDLVVIPIREYRKDGRIIRSIQKGAFSFAKTTTTELAKLGAKLALGTQTVLQGAEDYLVQPSTPQRLDNWGNADLDEDEKKQISLYADQPIGILQGLRGAYRHLERDLLMAKDAIIAMPGEVMESETAGGAARAVLRSAPTVILRPALGVTKAVGQTLLGATNSLDRGERRRVEDKYKRH